MHDPRYSPYKAAMQFFMRARLGLYRVPQSDSVGTLGDDATGGQVWLQGAARSGPQTPRASFEHQLGARQCQKPG